MTGMRRFLFLQGCTSPFFARLGDRLRRGGYGVYRINFNAGDALYWWRRPAWHYRGRAVELPAFLAPLFERYGFTDVVTLGDTRPVHAEALPVARRFGAQVHVLEEGYFRPNWLTLEEGGINGNSPLPRDPQWYREAGQLVPEPGEGQPVRNPLVLLGAHEVAYHAAGALNPILYPGYRTHRPHSSPVELFGWARRFAKMPWYRRRDGGRIRDLAAGDAPVYLLPLQLDSDSQIWAHSGFEGITELLETVVASFARHAPIGARLAIKNHPLDTGLTDFEAQVAALRRRLDLGSRLVYLETGHLPTLLERAAGVVTVNSSVGTSALIHGCPVIALGRAIYDIPGLTFQGPLDRFWQDAERPDRHLFRAFRRTVIHVSQVNGGFYTRDGMRLAVRHAAARLSRDRPPLVELLEATHGRAEVV